MQKITTIVEVAARTRIDRRQGGRMARLGKIIAWIWTVAMLLFAAFSAMERAWLPLAFYLIAFGLSMPLLRLPIGGKVRAVISVVLALAAAVIHGDELNRAADEDKAYWFAKMRLVESVTATIGFSMISVPVKSA
jgi:hypothetical protein